MRDAAKVLGLFACCAFSAACSIISGLDDYSIAPNSSDGTGASGGGGSSMSTAGGDGGYGGNGAAGGGGATGMCGDGVVQPERDEECDDGGTNDGDACSSACKEQFVVQVAMGQHHACALLNNGVVKCWGSNSYGELGLGDITNRGDGPGQMGSNLPAVDLGINAVATFIAAGAHHTCALLVGGDMKCWGFNSFGQLGIGDSENRGDNIGEMGVALPAVDLGAGVQAISVSAGYFHTCALLSNQSIKCWGYNAYGQLGAGDSIERGSSINDMGDELPVVDLGVGRTAVAVASGYNHTCAILNDGAVKCWGHNSQGQLGLGEMAVRGDDGGEMGDSLPTVELPPGRSAIHIAAGNDHTCVVLDDGDAFCWGGNDSGQLGLGDNINRGDDPGELGANLATVEIGVGTVTAMATGNAYTCALIDGVESKCWGRNEYGQLGMGDLLSRGDGAQEMGSNLPPIDFGAGNAALMIVGYYQHSCALLTTGRIKCWGRNDYGQLGLGDTIQRGDEAGEMGDNLQAVKLFSDAW